VARDENHVTRHMSLNTFLRIVFSDNPYFCGELLLLIYMQIVSHCQLFYVNLCLWLLILMCLVY